MTKKMFLLIFLAAFLVSSNIVFAIGVTPSSASLNYTPNAPAAGSFTIINNENVTMNIALTKGGDMAEYASIPTDIYQFAPEERKDFSYRITFPSEATPGTHVLKIGARQISEQTEGIGSAVAVDMLVSISVPYPPKYILTNLFVSDDVNASRRSMNITVTSLGSEDVDANGILTVKDYSGKIVYSKYFDEATYKSGTNTVLEEWLDASNFTIGGYTANVKFEYNGEETSMERQFSIGSPEIVIYGIKKGFMKQDQLTNITLLLHNNYGGNVTNAMVRLYMKDKILEVGPFSLGAFENKSVGIRVNTTYFKYGLYKSKIELSYSDKKIGEPIDVYIFPKYIEFLAFCIIIFVALVLMIEFMEIKGRKK